MTSSESISTDGEDPSGVPLSIRLADEKSLGIEALNPPEPVALMSQIRTIRVKLYTCPTATAAGATNPASGCSAVKQVNLAYAAGLSASPWKFRLTNLQVNKFYTASVEFLNQNSVGMIKEIYDVYGNTAGGLDGVAWPVNDKDDFIDREYIRTDAAGSITLPIDYGQPAYPPPVALQRLDYIVRLKDMSGGSVTDNRAQITEGAFAPGSEGFALVPLPTPTGTLLD